MLICDSESWILHPNLKCCILNAESWLVNPALWGLNLNPCSRNLTHKSCIMSPEFDSWVWFLYIEAESGSRIVNFESWMTPLEAWIWILIPESRLLDTASRILNLNFHSSILTPESCLLNPDFESRYLNSKFAFWILNPKSWSWILILNA